MTDEVKDIP